MRKMSRMESFPCCPRASMPVPKHTFRTERIFQPWDQCQVRKWLVTHDFKFNANFCVVRCLSVCHFEKTHCTMSSVQVTCHWSGQLYNACANPALNDTLGIWSWHKIVQPDELGLRTRLKMVNDFHKLHSSPFKQVTSNKSKPPISTFDLFCIIYQQPNCG